MRVASIDIGTNTVLLLVAEKDENGTLVAVEEHATITRLGQGVDKTRKLAPEAVTRTNDCLDRYAEIVQRLGATKVAVVGTSAMRDAGGGEEVRAHVRSRFGVEARTISGDEEARLTFKGALSGLSASRIGSRVAVFDIGGGSTEVVHGEPKTGRILYAHSYDVGSVRLTERHVTSDPPSEGERAAIARTVGDAFASVPELDVDAAPVGIAGTMTTLAAVSMKMATYDGARVHGHTMSIGELERVADELARVPLSVRRDLPGLEPKRADVIVAGASIALGFLRHVKAKEVTISDRGVRWGLAEELVAT
ncbi:MAG: Ppx/GppA family phosphatase [Deltaproteobacteria bacterium]|nr:Ppx/GppA family phosphatase [Deltaproteobacteria bacterium]